MSNRVYSRVWYHVVLATKSRKPFIIHEKEQEIYAHIKSQFEKMECIPVRINGMPDHVHVLFLGTPKKSTSDVMKQVKGATSHWINANNILPQKFEWRDGYSIFGVSESIVGRTKNYIDNQKRHHSNKTFQEEVIELFQEHGLPVASDFDQD